MLSLAKWFLLDRISLTSLVLFKVTSRGLGHALDSEYLPSLQLSLTDKVVRDGIIFDRVLKWTHRQRGHGTVMWEVPWRHSSMPQMTTLNLKRLIL